MRASRVGHAVAQERAHARGAHAHGLRRGQLAARIGDRPALPPQISSASAVARSSAARVGAEIDAALEAVGRIARERELARLALHRFGWKNAASKKTSVVPRPPWCRSRPSRRQRDRARRVGDREQAGRYSTSCSFSSLMRSPGS
jgi:hypothetical protein